MRALDLFAGAGGWSVACQRLGIVEHGVEIMPEARATRDAAGFITAFEDVWNPPVHPSFLGYDGLIASPPCQTFSLAGKGKGREALDDVLRIIPLVAGMSLEQLRYVGTETAGDERTALVLTPLWYALAMPHLKWLAWEQVPTVLPVWEACAEELREHGWNVWTGNLQAEQYGVSQTRKRSLLMASKVGEVRPPTPTHSKYYPRNPSKMDEGVKPWVSMAEALGWDAPPSTSYRSTTMPNSARRDVGTPAPTVAFGHDAASARWVRE